MRPRSVIRVTTVLAVAAVAAALLAAPSIAAQPEPVEHRPVVLVADLHLGRAQGVGQGAMDPVGVDRSHLGARPLMAVLVPDRDVHGRRRCHNARQMSTTSTPSRDVPLISPIARMPP